MESWEYKIYQTGKYNLDNDVEKQINEFGRNGWELVSVLNIQRGSDITYFIFKRK